MIWATEAIVRGEALNTRPGESSPWSRLDCATCDEVTRRNYGCRAPATVATFRSLTHPQLPVRNRCPRAIINPETDEYDPMIAELISVAGDMESTGIPYCAGGLRDQPASVIEARRLVSGTIARMHEIRIAHAERTQKRTQKRSTP